MSLLLTTVPVLLRADDGPSVDRNGALDEEDGGHHPEVGDGEYGAEVPVQGHELVSATQIKNIPYGQSSAKCEASCHPVTLVIEAQAEGLELTL